MVPLSFHFGMHVGICIDSQEISYTYLPLSILFHCLKKSRNLILTKQNWCGTNSLHVSSKLLQPTLFQMSWYFCIQPVGGDDGRF